MGGGAVVLGGFFGAALGALVTVLEPPELRRLVREWAAEIVRNNTNGD